MQSKGPNWDSVLEQRLKQFYKEYNKKHGTAIQDNAGKTFGRPKVKRDNIQAGHHNNAGNKDCLRRDKEEAGCR